MKITIDIPSPRHMSRRAAAIAVCAAACVVVAFAAHAQNPPQPPPTADPYANNAQPGAIQFPLAELWTDCELVRGLVRRTAAESTIG